MGRSLLEEMVELAKETMADNVKICDGSAKEFEELTQKMLADRALIALNPKTYPGCFLHRSAPHDVARTEKVTFICTRKKDDAGPTNNWMDPKEAGEKMTSLFRGSMRGRTMYVVPFSMGPVNSRFSRLGIEITDSPYVVLNMHYLVRIIPATRLSSEEPKDIMYGLHSLGDLSPEKRFIMHFPETNTVASIGSGYGGNALLGKKCFALRLASYIGRDEGWLAEHMMVLGLEDISGRITYIAGAFPSACGKTNLSMLASELPGYKVWTVSDDLCWLHVGADGRLWAINPESGFFAVAPGTGPATNPNMLAAVKRNTIFTNIALTPANEPWWEGIGTEAPEGLVDWQGRPWDKSGPAAHPNARFTAPFHQCPSASPEADKPNGVPISAIIFGGRRADTVPLLFEAFDWQHGMFLGLSIASETTAATTGEIGVLRRDPFAMLPFTGYNMADSVRHRLEVGAKLSRPPKVFHLNLFAQDDEGKYLWPGFKENIRLLKYIAERVHGEVSAKETPIGLVPNGYGIQIDEAQWEKEAVLLDTHLESLGNRLPEEMWEELAELRKRFGWY